jgi:hypothetical protein
MTASTNSLGSNLNPVVPINPDTGVGASADSQALIQQHSQFGEVDTQALADTLGAGQSGVDLAEVMANLPAAKREELSDILSNKPTLIAGNIPNGNGTLSNANNAMAEMKSALGAPSVAQAIPQIRGASTSSQIFQTLNGIAMKYGFADAFAAVGAYQQHLGSAQKFERQVSGLVGALKTNPTAQERKNFDREIAQPARQQYDQFAQGVNNLASTNVVPEIQASAQTRAEQQTLNRQRDALASLGVSGLPAKVIADGKNGPDTQTLRDGLQGRSVNTANIQVQTNATLAQHGRGERVVVDGIWGQDTASMAALAKNLQSGANRQTTSAVPRATPQPAPVQTPPPQDNRNPFQRAYDGAVGFVGDAKQAVDYTLKDPKSLLDSTVESVVALPKFGQSVGHGVSFGIIPRPEANTPTERLSSDIGVVTGNVLFGVSTGGAGNISNGGKAALFGLNAGGQNLLTQARGDKPLNATSVAVDVVTAPAGMLIPGGQTAAGTIVRQVAGGVAIDTSQQLGQQFAQDGRIDPNKIDLGQLALGTAGNFIPSPKKNPTYTSSDGTKTTVVAADADLGPLKSAAPVESTPSRPASQDSTPATPSASQAPIVAPVVTQQTSKPVTQTTDVPVATPNKSAPTPTVTAPSVPVPSNAAAPTSRKLEFSGAPSDNTKTNSQRASSVLFDANGQRPANNPFALNNAASTMYQAAGFQQKSIANMFGSLPSFAQGRPHEVGLISAHGANLATGNSVPHPTNAGVNVIIPQAMTFKVPVGRTVTVMAVEGGTIYDRLGNAVETYAAGYQRVQGGDQNAATAASQSAGQQAAYSKTYSAGDDAPVTMFVHPKGLDIGGQAVTLFPNNPDAGVSGMPIISIPPGRAVSIVEMMEKYPNIKDWVVCACQENPVLPGRVNTSDVGQLGGPNSNQIQSPDANALFGVPNAFTTDGNGAAMHDWTVGTIQSDGLMGDFLRYTLNNPSTSLDYNVAKPATASPDPSNTGATPSPNAGQQRLNNILGDSLTPTGAQRGNGAGDAAPEWKGSYQPSTQYSKASEIGVLRPDSAQWKQAIAALKDGGADNINNIRVPTASDAKQLLKAAFGDQLQHQLTYIEPQSPGTYQLHPSEIEAGQGIYNNLSHIKIVEPSGRASHIWFGKTDTTNASVNYLSSRGIEALSRQTGLSVDELSQLGIRAGSNAIDGSGSQYPQVLQPNPENPHTTINGHPIGR